MKVPVVGFSYQERSLPFANDRTINWYPVVGQASREPTMLYPTPGLSSFSASINDKVPIRGLYAAANGRAIGVAGDEIREITSTGFTTDGSGLPGINTSTGYVTFADNGDQVAVCDGADLYIINLADRTLSAEVSDTDFPGAGTVCFLDGYFIVNVPNAGQIYISGLYDGLSWDALEFATAEGLPDNIVRVFSAYGNLWIFGDLSTEIWAITGNTDFPFARQSRMETGCAGAHTVASLDNTIFWLGRDKDGDSIVYRVQGASPVRVSTTAIEKKLSAVADKTALKAWTYQKNGHAFYAITGGSLDTTLVYDASTGVWHERAYLNELGVFEQHLAMDCIFCFGYHIVGDRRNSNIYKMQDDVYTDNGSYIRRQRNFKLPSKENETYSLNELEILFESGTGLNTGQGSSPNALLKISNDGGRTYSTEYSASIGAQGAYGARTSWRRLGNASAWDIELAVTDPVKAVVIGGFAK